MCQEVRPDVEKTQAPIQTMEFQLKQAQDREYLRGRNTAGYARAFMTEAETLAELFKCHAPNETTIPKYAAINQAAKNFAEVILQNSPPSADRSDAIRKIREARMTANAAIALNGLSL